MPTSKAPARPRVQVLNVNVPGSTTNVDGIRYEATRLALLKALPRTKPGLTQAEMIEKTAAYLPDDEFPGGAKAGWWVKCVQLDQEARGVIERDRSAKPLRWYRIK